MQSVAGARLLPVDDAFNILWLTNIDTCCLLQHISPCTTPNCGIRASNAAATAASKTSHDSNQGCILNSPFKSHTRRCITITAASSTRLCYAQAPRRELHDRYRHCTDLRDRSCFNGPRTAPHVIQIHAVQHLRLLEVAKIYMDATAILCLIRIDVVESEICRGFDVSNFCLVPIQRHQM